MALGIHEDSPVCWTVLTIYNLPPLSHRTCIHITSTSAIKIQHALGENWALNIPKSLFFNKKYYFKEVIKRAVSINEWPNKYFYMHRVQRIFALMTIQFLRNGRFYIWFEIWYYITQNLIISCMLASLLLAQHFLLILLRNSKDFSALLED